ncbi:ABC1 kinase family protein [Aeromicrobium sp. CTD01-1L150]|uniref:ABC1 kinase family protein n=1 Tax=Aeromicrobium sp. CTD01-1L150 TaxID=3341830 RepID=UPI0035C0E699
MGSSLVLISALVNAFFIAVVARRLLGVPVGWPRTIVLSLLLNAVAVPLVTWILDALGARLDPTSGQDAAVVMAIAVLTIAWLIALEVGLLVLLEALVPTGSLLGPVPFLQSLPARSRRGQRYARIVAIATRHGLGGFLTTRGTRHGVETSTSSTARALRLALTDAGVTFVKLGQMLSSRPDLVRPEFVQELSRLQSDVAAQPWSTVRGTLEQELGSLDAIFTHVDPEPLAAASIGQVHRAQLVGGERVVVKVQRSDARAQVTADLDIIGRLARWLDRTQPWARDLGVRDLAEGFAASLEEELDHRVEAENVEAVRGVGSRAEPPVSVPAVHRSTARVLIMEELAGTPLSGAADLLAALPDDVRRSHADALLTTVLEQMLESGIFHADLHPGNVLIDADGGLSLLDFGSVGRLDRGARLSLGLLLLAIDRQDAAAATRALCDVLDHPPSLDSRALERDLAQLIMRFGSSAGRTSDLFVQLLRVVLRHGLSIPPSLAAALRALGALEGTLQTLDPEVDLVAAARERGRSVVTRRIGPGGVKEEIEDQLVTLLPTLQRLPHRLSSILEDVEGGRLTVTLRTFQDPAERRFLSGLVQQVVTAILAATAALSGILLLMVDRGPELTDQLTLGAYLGGVLVLFAFVLGARLLVLVFRSGRDHDVGMSRWHS